MSFAKLPNRKKICESKVIYLKYSKHWLSTVAHKIDCVCSKKIKSVFKSFVIIFTFQVFGWKNILNQLENSGLKSRFLFCLILQIARSLVDVM